MRYAGVVFLLWLRRACVVLCALHVWCLSSVSALLVTCLVQVLALVLVLMPLVMQVLDVSVCVGGAAAFCLC